ncbi:MAG: hypothetical protein WC807_16570 [Hyphomicrobium sp.]
MDAEPLVLSGKLDVKKLIDADAEARGGWIGRWGDIEDRRINLVGIKGRAGGFEDFVVGKRGQALQDGSAELSRRNVVTGGVIGF